MKASRGLFCTVTQRPGHGGIARVSELLWRVMQNQPTQAWGLAVAAPEGNSLTNKQKIFFSLRVFLRQMLGDCDFLFFDHLGLARIQRLVPRSCRRPYGVFLHGVEAWTRLSPDRLEVLKGAALRVANSHYTAHRIEETHPGIGQIEICHLALDTHPAQRDPPNAELVGPTKCRSHRGPHVCLGTL